MGITIAGRSSCGSVLFLHAFYRITASQVFSVFPHAGIPSVAIPSNPAVLLLGLVQTVLSASDGIVGSVSAGRQGLVWSADGCWGSLAVFLPSCFYVVTIIQRFPTSVGFDRCGVIWIIFKSHGFGTPADLSG